MAQDSLKIERYPEATRTGMGVTQVAAGFGVAEQAAAGLWESGPYDGQPLE
jgi:hypothetical protein